MKGVNRYKSEGFEGGVYVKGSTEAERKGKEGWRILMGSDLVQDILM